MLNDIVRREIIIKTHSDEEEYEVANKIHNQLVGNEDYRKTRIILSMSRSNPDIEKNEVHLYIFNDSKSDPEIRI